MNIADFPVASSTYQGANAILKLNKLDLVSDNIKAMIDDLRLELTDAVEDIEALHKEASAANDPWTFEEADGVLAKNICGWILWYIHNFDDFIFDSFASLWIAVYPDATGLEGPSETRRSVFDAIYHEEELEEIASKMLRSFLDWLEDVVIPVEIEKAAAKKVATGS